MTSGDVHGTVASTAELDGEAVKMRRSLFAFGVFVGALALPAGTVDAQERVDDTAAPAREQRHEELLDAEGPGDSVPLARLGAILAAAGGVALYGAQRHQGRRSAFPAG